MRKIVLRKIERRNNKYCFDLGNNTSHEFSSKRDAKAYINKTNLFLTEKLYQAHSLYTECLIKYNSYWGYFGHRSILKKSNEDFVCKTQLKNAQDCLSNIPAACFGSHANFFIYDMFINAFICLKNTSKILIAIAKSKSITQDIYSLNDLIKRITYLENELRNYGIDNCTYFIEPGKKSNFNYNLKMKRA